MTVQDDKIAHAGKSRINEFGEIVRDEHTPREVTEIQEHTSESSDLAAVIREVRLRKGLEIKL